MKVGLMVNTQAHPGVDMRAQVPEMIEQVRVARDLGFSSLWFPQHYLTAPTQMLQLSAVLPFLMAEAKGMTVGSDIIILPLQNPVALAEEAATLDVLSGGNYVLGVGLGYREQEYEAFGIPLSERAPRFSESVGLMRRLWTEERVTHHGRFHRITEAGLSIRPSRPGGVPIWVAAQVNAAIKRAAAIGDAWLIVPGMDYDTLIPSMQLYRDTLREVGKEWPTEIPISRECYIGTTMASAVDDCREVLRYKYASYDTWGLQNKLSEAESAKFDKMMRESFIIGDKAFVKDEIARYSETLGVNHFIMRVQWPGLSHEKALQCIRSLAEIFA